jgi:hypothetical protein
LHFDFVIFTHHARALPKEFQQQISGDLFTKQLMEIPRFNLTFRHLYYDRAYLEELLILFINKLLVGI